MQAVAVVTGGAGFLGSHLCDALLERDYRVVALDNLITGSRDNVAHLEAETRFELIEHDVREPWPALAAPPSLVLHMASPASPPAYLAHPIETLEVSSIGTAHALDLARDHEATFLLASTSEIYGDPEVSPQRESYRGSVSTTGPRSVYDEAKRYAEALTMAHHRTFGTATRIVRIFNTYGPRLQPADGRAISNFVVQALAGEPLTVYGDGTQTRSFCFVEDLIRGILALADSDETQPVNLGNPDERTILEIAKLVIEATKSSSTIEHRPLPEDDPLQRRPDITRARDVLGWEPRVALDEGLPRTIAWLRERLSS